LAHEHKTGALGTTASGEYFPTWVQFIPRTSSLEEAIAKGENPQRFEPRSLPAGAGILSEQTSPLSFSLHITSPKSFRATFLHFYFPGWQGYVDGQPVPTTPSAGQGFSTFEVPEGEHQISLKFDSTPIRDNAILISLCSMVIGSLLLIVHQVQLSGNTRLIVQTNLDQLQPVGHGQAPVWAYGVLGIVLLLFKVGIVDRVDTPLRVTFDGVRVHTVQYARSVGFSRVLTWLGYDLSAESVFPGQVFNLTLYWQAQRELDTVYSSFAHLIDERANLYAQKDNLHPGNTPTTTWRRREFNVDRHPIEVPAGTPPGDYWIEIGMYDPRTGARLLRESTSENQPPDRILIGPVRVLKSAQPPSVPALGIKQPLDKRWANGLSLLGFSLERDRLPADDFLRVALFWRADSAPLSDLSMTLRLLDAQGQAVTVQSSAPSNNRYPTNRWSAGETVRDNRSLWIPRALPNGVYRLQLRLDGNESWIDLTAARKQ